jgi:hypothetical protein
MKKANSPTVPGKESLEQMPELDQTRFRRRPGRGHHQHLRLGGIVAIDADLWAHFGSAQAVNEALRTLLAQSASRK